ncbi:MAG: toxin-antitoxin system protein [Actinomycetota bacterium]|nr:toxin-antitoxin system protein [Actinomycetota bacterium]
MTATTIKVSPETRDRIAAIAKERSLTANSVVEMLLANYLRDERMNAVRRAMATTSAEDWRTYDEETADWDVVAGDGLKGW